MNSPMLRIDGEVDRSLTLTFDEMGAIPAEHQIDDVSRIDPKRKGEAIRLKGLLQLAGCKPTAKYLGLHSATDDFHASIPLEPVRDRALIIYRLDGKPLSAASGGPFRFYIPDSAACQTHEIDECANVKFVDHLELTATPGFDNRPHDGQAHEELHRRQQPPSA